MIVAPIRLRLSRCKGFNLQALSRATNGLDAVVVARRGLRGRGWGNPCRVGSFEGYGNAEAVRDYRLWLARDPTVRSFESVFGKPPSTAEIRASLQGKNLACWCKPADPCHADVLLEIANR